ncbi:discoidin domain-containing protein [Actinoplanes sp. NPDC020271]|uniref:discoidin domain-containing protein n=1 Tax=Actinoplanes sp. NPDC020271 TaxID=3363896 RepID=UPI003799261F
MTDFDEQRRPPSRAENLRLTRMPSLPPRPGTTGSIPLPAVGTPAPEPVPAPARRRRRRGGLLIGLALLLAAAGGGIAYRWKSDAVASPPLSAPTTFPAVGGPSPTESPSGSGPGAVAAAPSPATPSVVLSAAPSARLPSARLPSARTSSAAGRANTSGANLALHATCSASGSEADSWQAKYACDGDLETRWSSAFTDTQWIRADLGSTWQLTGVTLVWERSYGASYRVETSLDGKTWTRLYVTGSGQGGTEEIPAKGAAARFVRMVGVKRVSQYGYSLMEFEIR